MLAKQKPNKHTQSLTQTQQYVPDQYDSVQTPQRTEKRKKQLYDKFVIRFNEQLNPKRNEATQKFIEKTLQNYIFKENRILGSKEISSLEAMIVQFQKNLSQSQQQTQSQLINSQNSQRLAPLQQRSNLQQKLKSLEQSLQERNQQLLENSQNSKHRKSQSQEILQKSLNQTRDSINKAYGLQNQLQGSEQRQSLQSQQSQKSIKSIQSKLSNISNRSKAKSTSSNNLLIPFLRKNQTVDYDQISVQSTQSAKSVVMLSQQGKNWDEYAAILDYNTRKHYQSIEEKEIQKKLKQKEVMRDLQKQIEEKEQKKEQEKKRDKYFYGLELDQQERYDQNEHTKAEKWRNNQNNILQKLDQQVNLKSYLDKKEKKQEVKYEKSLVDLYRKKLEEDTLKQKEKKLQGIKFMNKVWLDSLQERTKLEDEQKQLLLQDREGTNMYGKILKEQHQKREIDRINRLEKQNEVINRWDNIIERQKLEQEEKEKQKEKLLQRYQKEEEQRIQQIEDEKLERVNMLRQQMIEENRNQMELKNTRVDPIKQESVEQGKIWVREDRQYLEKEAQKQLSQRQRQIAYQKQLEKQIKDQELHKQRELMNKQELLQNKSLLKEIAADQIQLQQSMQASQQDEVLKQQLQQNSSSNPMIKSKQQPQNFMSSYSNDPNYGKNLTLKSIKMQDCDRM